MTSLFFDTNALIYWAHLQSKYCEEVSTLIYAATANNSSLYALSSSLNEVYYVLHRHYMTEAKARESIREIAEVFDLVDLTGPFVFGSIDSNEPDYEDGLIRVAAEALQADAIITYDQAAFKNSFIPKMTAAEAFEKLFSEN